MAKTKWDPSSLLKLSGQYWETCTLHTGVKLGVFTHLGAEAMDAKELTAAAKLNTRGATLLLDALTALGLLEKEAGVYRNTAPSKQFLDRQSKDYIGHMIMHHHHLVESWGRMDQAVKSGKPLSPSEDIDDEDSRREAFLMGMYNIASQQTKEITSVIDLNGRKRLLDLGGGPGTYAIGFCKQNPGLKAVIFDLPTTRPFAEKTVAQHDLSERIMFTPGDFVSDPLDGPFDVIWISHILHSEGPENCAALIKKAVAATAPGGIILIHDFYLNETMDGPVFPALFALNMLHATKTGRSYSEMEVRKMFYDAGVTEVERLDYTGPTESGILKGVVTG